LFACAGLGQNRRVLSFVPWLDVAEALYGLIRPDGRKAFLIAQSTPNFYLRQNAGGTRVDSVTAMRGVEAFLSPRADEVTWGCEYR
jgi:hypothetical protein